MAKTVTHICNKETEIALILKQQQYHTEMLEKMDHRLFGNGKPGILDEQSRRIDVMEKKMIFYAGAVIVITAIVIYFADKIFK